MNARESMRSRLPVLLMAMFAFHQPVVADTPFTGEKTAWRLAVPAATIWASSASSPAGAETPILAACTAAASTRSGSPAPCRSSVRPARYRACAASNAARFACAATDSRPHAAAHASKAGADLLVRAVLEPPRLSFPFGGEHFGDRLGYLLIADRAAARLRVGEKPAQLFVGVAAR